MYRWEKKWARLWRGERGADLRSGMAETLANGALLECVNSGERVSSLPAKGLLSCDRADGAEVGVAGSAATALRVGEWVSAPEGNAGGCPSGSPAAGPVGPTVCLMFVLCLAWGGFFPSAPAGRGGEASLSYSSCGELNGVLGSLLGSACSCVTPAGETLP